MSKFNKISDGEMVDFLKMFIRQMLEEEYSVEYIGRMCAVVIHANDQNE